MSSLEQGGGAVTLSPLRTSISGSGASGAPPLRASLSGGVPSPVRPTPPQPRTSSGGNGPASSSSNIRMSSPGVLGNLLSANGPGPLTPHLPLTRAPSTDLPRLPATSRTSESGGGDKGSRPSPPAFRRAATMVRSMDSSLSTATVSPVAASRGDAMLKDRRALQQDKNALMLNKRRLEALMHKMLDALPLEEERPSPQSLRGGGGGSLRSQAAKALEESALLDKHMAGGPGGGMNLFAAESDAKLREMEAAMEELKLDTEVAVSRVESELKYRNTQAAAAAAGLQKQLAEAEEELGRLRRGMAAEQGRVQNLNSQVGELQRHLKDVTTSLNDKTEQVVDMKQLMGMDKVTMNTVLEMLRSQLKEAKGEVAAKVERIAELEYAVVARDHLLAEAQHRSGGGGGGAAAAAAEESTEPMDAKSAWGKLAKAVAGTRAKRVPSGGGGPSGGAGVSANGSTRGSACKGVLGGGGGILSGGLKAPAGSSLAGGDSYGADAFEADE